MATGSERYRKHSVWETLELKKDALAAARYDDAPTEQWRKDERREGPADGEVWLDVATSARVLGVHRNRILQKVHAGRLPATQVGRRWWLRRLHVEQAAAARAFRGRE